MSWSRAEWIDAFEGLTVAFDRAASAGGSPARARLPGAPPDDPIPSLEGFARMSVAWGAWLGEGTNPATIGSRSAEVDLLELMRRGLADGADPDSPWWWGSIGDRDQRIVEAAEIATGLWLGRERLIPALGPTTLALVLDWLGQVDGRDVYDDNWVLFPSIVAAVRRALGREVDDRAIDTGIDWMLARYRGDGWYADGRGHAFDQYTGWAIHWHLMLWSRIEGDRRPAIRRQIERRFATYLSGIVASFAADGSRPLYGRSLGYRFAAAAPFALAALLGVDAVPHDVARRIGGGTVRRHLGDAALDPDTGWFRRGVGGERPDVCERYMSAGASAWAAHAFVSLGLPAGSPYWQAIEGRLPVEDADGVRPLRGPGLLFGRRRRTGETWLLNARADHPDDIPGHDYTPYYGKFAYRSHFPFTVRTAAGTPGPDGAVAFVDGATAGHRALTHSGNVGPSWTWSRYRMAGERGTHAATTVMLTWHDLEIRLTEFRPGGAVLLMEGAAAIGAGSAGDVARTVADGIATAATATHSVAIRSLVGYDAVVHDANAGLGTGRNLVADHAETPLAVETRASSLRRIIGTVSWAGAAADAPIADLRAVLFLGTVGDVATVALGPTERAAVALGWRAVPSIEVTGIAAVGPAVRLLRVAADGSSAAGESILTIDGVVRLDRAGPISVRLGTDHVDAWAECGFAVEPSWAGFVPGWISVRDRTDGWSPPVRLPEAGAVTSSLIQRLRRSTGRQLLELRLTP